jgi:hypothetical protein
MALRVAKAHGLARAGPRSALRAALPGPLRTSRVTRQVTVSAAGREEAAAFEVSSADVECPPVPDVALVNIIAMHKRAFRIITSLIHSIPPGAAQFGSSTCHASRRSVAKGLLACPLACIGN